VKATHTTTPPPTASNSTELATPEECAKRLKISRRCLTNWDKRRVIPSILIGRVRRYDLAKVKTALEKFEQVEITR
jgi:hypothetical protein